MEQTKVVMQLKTGEKYAKLPHLRKHEDLRGCHQWSCEGQGENYIPMQELLILLNTHKEMTAMLRKTTHSKNEPHTAMVPAELQPDLMRRHHP